MKLPPVLESEFDRLMTLSEYDLDYLNLSEHFRDLTTLAARVAGTDISLVNLIDNYTQWTVSGHGLSIEQMPREDSVCQYTITEEGFFEVKNLAMDERFADKPYVLDEPKLKYYFGVPLQTSDGYNLGALCVMDKEPRSLPPEKLELLKIVAGEIVNRLNSLRVIDGLKSKVKEARETKLKVAHDIRGPLNGIISLAKIISEQGNDNNLDDVLKFIGLIQKSGSSILELADTILNDEVSKKQVGSAKDPALNLGVFKETLEKLYLPQALGKKIKLVIEVNNEAAGLPCAKGKLLQIAGNLISNAIKFTPEGGRITATFAEGSDGKSNVLRITVSDTGVGLTPKAISDIKNNINASANGTGGEQGYGFGLALVKHLVHNLNGTFDIESMPGEGSTFIITLPEA